MADYQIWLRNPVGDLIAVIDAFNELQYTRVANTVGTLRLTMPDLWDSKQNLYLFDQFAVDSRIEVWRSVNGGQQYLDGDTQFFVRKPVRALTAQNERLIEINAVDANHLLERRYVLYAGDTATANVINVAADDLCKNIVLQNMGNLATDTTRDLSAWLTVQANATGAPLLSKQFGYRKVYDVLREIVAAAAVAGTYFAFDIVWLSGTNPQLQFQTYLNFRGIDHRYGTGVNPVVLDVDAGNLLDVRMELDYDNEVNYVYVGGQGDGSLRLTATRQDTQRMNISPFNRMERFKDSRNSDTAAKLNADGDMTLRDNRPRRVFSGKLNQIPGCLYGVHYRFGDVVSANFVNTTLQCRMDGITVKVLNSVETVDATVRADELLG